MRYLVIIFCLLLVQSLSAQNDESSPIIFIYDASGSMWGGMDGSTKMQIASDVMGTVVEDLDDGQRTGLVAYGHRRKGDCSDVETLVNINNTNKGAVVSAIADIDPLGKTPLAASALEVIDQLRAEGLPATIILLTDGIETCGGDLCKIVRDARAQGIEFIMHVVGFGIAEENVDQLKCAAEAGEGRYFDAGDGDALSSVLRQATRHTVDKGIGNLAVYTKKNQEGMDALIKIYAQGNTRDVLYTERTYGDTARFVLPAGRYEMEAEPLVSSDLKTIFVENVHIIGDANVTEVVSFDAGTIVVSTTNNNKGWDAVVTIHDSKTGEAVTRGRTYGDQDEYDLEPGEYDVVVKALEVNGVAVEHRVQGVEVTSGGNHEVSHNFESGVLLVGANSQDGLVDAIVSIFHTDSDTPVAQGRTYTSDSSNPKSFTLIPGEYRVEVKGLKAFEGEVQTIELEVLANDTITEEVTFKVQ